MVMVSDGTASVSRAFTWNVASAITLPPIPTQQSNEGSTVSFTLHASGATSGATLTYSAAGLPPGLSLNASTGVISGTISAGAANTGAFAPAVVVSDGTASSSQAFTWNIASPITITPIPTQQSSEGGIVSFSLHATDATSGATLIYTAAGLPPGLSLNASTGVISGTIAAGAASTGAFSPVVTVSDGTASNSRGFTWNVASALTLTPIPNQQSNEGGTVSFTLHASDATGGATLTYTAACRTDGNLCHFLGGYLISASDHHLTRPGSAPGSHPFGVPLRHNARPMPLLPPVMTATLFVKPLMSSSCVVDWWDVANVVPGPTRFAIRCHESHQRLGRRLGHGPTATAGGTGARRHR
jgi:hypothetical protein